MIIVIFKVFNRIIIKSKLFTIKLLDFTNVVYFYDKFVFNPIVEKSRFNYNLISKNSSNYLKKNQNINKNKDIIDHKFRLLGSNKVQVRYLTRDKMQEDFQYKFFHDPSYIKKLKQDIQRSLGSNNLQMNYEPIDWQLDFISGYRWSQKTWYMDIKVFNIPKADIKVPWELSRMQHLPKLAINYFLDKKNEDNAKECVFQITDWIMNNKVRYGVNWRTSMEVAIRACNLLLTLELIKDSKYIDSKFIFILKKSLIEHGQHIMKNLEKSFYFRGHNHYMANVVGLIFLGVCIDSKFSKRWLKFGLKEFYKSIDNQFKDDGGNFEGSSYYHRLVFEMVFYTLTLIKKNESYIKKYIGSDFLIPNKIMVKFYKSYHFLKSIVAPNGKLFQYGDNDSGKFFDYLSVDEIGFNKNLLRLAGGSSSKGGVEQSALGLFINLKDQSNFFEIKTDKHNSYRISKEAIYYPKSKFYIYSNSIYSVICVLRPSFLGHTHNDLFSFELFLQNKPIIVDGGSFCYTSDLKMRDKFRNTINHNTLFLKDKEQNILDGVVSMKGLSFPNIKKIFKDGFIASHNGYEIEHERHFNFYDNEIKIKDNYKGESYLSLNLAPNLKYQKNKSNEIQLYNSGSQLSLKVAELEFIEHQEGFYSSGYGKRIKNLRLIFKRKSSETEVTFKFLGR